MKSVRPSRVSEAPKAPKAGNVGGTPSGGPDFAPIPRRSSHPKWLDPRIIGGLLLVIAAVVVGARVIGASSHTAPVWVAARDLAAGTVLTSADVESVSVNLGDSADRYLLADETRNAVVGRALNEPLHGGEFVPVAALSDPENGRIIVIGVTPDRMPPGVTHGSKIDLYLTGSSEASGSRAPTTLIASAITVQSVAAPSSGGLSGATSTRFQVAVLLDAPTADKLVRTLPNGDPIVVLVSGR